MKSTMTYVTKDGKTRLAHHSVDGEEMPTEADLAGTDGPSATREKRTRKRGITDEQKTAPERSIDSE